MNKPLSNREKSVREKAVDQNHFAPEPHHSQDSKFSRGVKVYDRYEIYRKTRK